MNKIYNVFLKIPTIYILLRDILIGKILPILSEKKKFELIYKTGYWKSKNSDSFSGGGSNIESTSKIRRSLQKFLQEREIKTMLDLPCGDWSWMSKVDLTGIEYIGGDIVDDIIFKNTAKYPNYKFQILDVVNDNLPAVDLLFVRDCLVHLEEEQIKAVFDKVVRSGSTYFATTIHVKCQENATPSAADRWRKINFTIEPYNLEEPIYLLDDRYAENGVDEDKYIGIWRISEMQSLLTN
jgi:hypothetical protein